MPRVVILVLLLLAGCAGSGPGLPPPAPVPGPLPRPGVLTFAADWTAPLRAASRCGGPGLASPFTCDLPPDAIWGVLLRGDGRAPCADPVPNLCYDLTADGLHFKYLNPGTALISARTFDGGKPISVEAVMTVHNDCADVSFAGPVIYGGGVDDGDPLGTYAAAYISCTAPSDTPKVWIYRPTMAAPISGPVSPGPHALRIDYTPGSGFVILLDGAVILDHELGSDPLTFPNDPHAALWLGAADGVVHGFNVYTWR